MDQVLIIDVLPYDNYKGNIEELLANVSQSMGKVG